MYKGKNNNNFSTGSFARKDLKEVNGIIYTEAELNEKKLTLQYAINMAKSILEQKRIWVDLTDLPEPYKHMPRSTALSLLDIDKAVSSIVSYGYSLRGGR